MAKTLKTVTAGPMVLQAIYPRADGRDEKTRAEKKKISSAAQRRLNLKNSTQKLELMIWQNFRPDRDLVLTLTCDQEHECRTRQAMNAKLKRFRKDLGKLYSKRNPFRMVWAIENKHGEARFHVHAVLTWPGGEPHEVYAKLFAIWGLGNVEIRKLKNNRDENPTALARYMNKEPADEDRVGLRGWSYTRSCTHPTVETERVDEDTPLRCPKGAQELQSEKVTNEFGSYTILKYIWPKTGRRRTRKK